MVLTIALTALLAHSPGAARPQPNVPSGRISPAISSLQQVAALSSSARANAGYATLRHSALAHSSIHHELTHHELTPTGRNLAVDLHPMTEEERTMYPGRERFDKTEWYESQFKSAKVVTLPEHVDEWNNGGIDAA